MMRLDQLLVARGLARSRTRAQRLIRNGRVALESDPATPLTKPGEKLPDDACLLLTEDDEERYASRAGLKLEALLDTLDLRLDGKIVLDVGQSTGGFTDCALRHGAAHVIGVEVGHGQLDSRLRHDPRVTCLEGLNARAMAADPSLQEANEQNAPAGIAVAVMDVSFISQTLILPELGHLLESGAELLSLVKPQFEVGPGRVDHRGIVRDPSCYADVERRLRDCCAEHGFEVLSWHDSPILGGDGNREFLLHARRR
ncbi:23S rRNA (cytidine1920-2'-O)/16S rRNA (cytidine1409-2'-O)-methyltransferase [Modicisalibacter ilicicola DSM 19980]|uniref:23S rRNA (Cytidine1920-2'-O)/16S rRNA (Cytidine1409-2'-O)-methyltransferase n=1 Tax=Modicisalibacter ilicicola DSM 19980 TaxID=1121942 RepID=A0A1M4YHY0_9GAMM|nr:TlyA family RNA methyltransferase [Halomonas ilicicola]SHF05281.1 23S rRNA (cytidine1920-2'-O)/16S rRNA (cytidine1409-2'-O)-methyltransferase [Halomonas ilicicola DSM 19980]